MSLGRDACYKKVYYIFQDVAPKIFTKECMVWQLDYSKIDRPELIYMAYVKLFLAF